MKILITGATGFIGSVVAAKLRGKYGYENIIALSSRNIETVSVIPSLGYGFDDTYLVDNGCSDVEVLFHIGAFTPKAASDVDDLTLTTGNIMATQKILMSKLPGLKRIIFVSTLDVYAHCSGILSESSLTVPSTLYGWSKLYCEQMIMKHCKENDLSYEILRLGHVYGEGEEVYRKVMPVMVRNAIEGQDLKIYGDGNAIRSFIYIDDVAKAIVNAIDVENSEIINVAGDEMVTIRQLAELICTYEKKQIQIIHVRSSAPNINYIFDNTKMKNLLLRDLTPLQIGLKREYEYMQEKLKS